MWTVTLLFTLSIISGRASWADLVELKTGQRVDGTFKHASWAGVVIDVGGHAGGDREGLPSRLISGTRMRRPLSEIHVAPGIMGRGHDLSIDGDVDEIRFVRTQRLLQDRF